MTTTRTRPPVGTGRRAPHRPARPAAASAASAASAARTSGLLLAAAGGVLLMGFVTAEAVFPGTYSTHANTLSHLGASEPPDSVVSQPSAAIFDSTMVVAGLLIVAGAAFLQRAHARRRLSVATGLLGVGAAGVGIFPLTHLTPHTLLALLAFLAGPTAAILSGAVTPAPLRHVVRTLGVVALIGIGLGLFLLEWGPVAELGEGGIERWNAYPTVLWLVVFGGSLMASERAAGDERALG